MTFELSRLPQPLRLRQVTKDPLWYGFLKWFFVCVAPLVLLAIFFGGFWLGGGSRAEVAPAPRVIERVIEKPASTRSHRPSAPTVSTSVSREECERYYVLTLHEAVGNRCR